MPKLKAIHQLVIDGQVIAPGKTVDVAKEHVERLIRLGAATRVTGEPAEDVVEQPVEQVAETQQADAPAEDKPVKSGKSTKKAADDLV